ncbi:MAG: glycosyltransferase family 2 protein [Bdellovibrionaceae bacterium]|nr:glycosyltransferase family 2 protein [Bdellovibrionales bacterium]MCB9084593.1 glycosyltransferase family 2 protein [Pseudobdellovibrionaceae bacterium]
MSQQETTVNSNSDQLVSIITPVYNSEAFINKAMDSVQSQTYPHWEMLVVMDAGTTDRTPMLVQQRAKEDSRIKLIQVPQGKGLALSRNYAISQAQGRYIAFLDSDDLWLPDKLTQQIDFMRKNDYAFTCTAFRRIDVAGHKKGRLIEVPQEITYSRLLQQNCIGCLTVVLDKTKTGPVEFQETKHEDFILWLDLIKKGHACYGLNQDLARYRIVDASRSADKFESVRNTWRIYREVEGLSLPHAALRLSQFAMRNLSKYSRF